MGYTPNEIAIKSRDNDQQGWGSSGITGAGMKSPTIGTASYKIS